jgi:hypothetical protein
MGKASGHRGIIFKIVVLICKHHSILYTMYSTQRSQSKYRKGFISLPKEQKRSEKWQ